LTTTSAASFEQWYHDTDGVNITLLRSLPLTEEGPGILSYHGYNFFPIDGAGFGNEMWPHNYHFTVEIHTGLHFQGDETLVIAGANDYWLFINGQLVIDGGGVHAVTTGSVTLDAAAVALLGLRSGNVYPVDVFFAQRHTTTSEFHLTASARLVDYTDLIFRNGFESTP
jgi:fibro-slime domain-containing protein